MSYHINYVNQQISKNIGVLSRLRHFMYGIVLKLLYNSLILPYFVYCNIVWAPSILLICLKNLFCNSDQYVLLPNQVITLIQILYFAINRY